VVTIIDVYPPPQPQAVPAQTTPAPAAPPPQQQSQGLQCNPPRSQLESEQCAQRQGRAPQPTPPPVATTPEPTGDICHDGLDNEGVSGLVDGADPNCQ
jgi:hypothetical protein